MRGINKPTPLSPLARFLNLGYYLYDPIISINVRPSPPPPPPQKEQFFYDKIRRKKQLKQLKHK